MIPDSGRRAYFRFDTELDADTLRAEDFSLLDDLENRFLPYRAELCDDFCTVRLTFADFNPAHGICRACYTPGTLHSYFGERVLQTEREFLPVGLHGTEAS